MKNDPILSLAISMQANPGIYALLLGSGISRSAGIPTGWEVVRDLASKVASARGKDAGLEPEKWYEETFGESPSYSNLLDRLARTPAERQGLLRSYFEPNEDEREQGLKLPTPAHRAIATLVKQRYIRMILTTNFDRLLELALEAEGVRPDVIASDDALQGALPYVHSQCYVVKLHGDYRDTRIKNTPVELATYSEEMNKLLDRVLDEFGLIICGWSAEYDTALKDAILRAPNRRFTTYWVKRGSLTPEAQDIISHRRAEVIQAESADQFFTDLAEKVKSLAELRRARPESIEVAIATVKRYVPDPVHRVRLWDLLHEEAESLYTELFSDRFAASGGFTKESFQERLRDYEAMVERLAKMAATLAFHDTGENARILPEIAERLAGVPALPSSYPSFEDSWRLRFYPALLILYSAGISALAGERYSNLAALLRNPRRHDSSRGERLPVLQHVNAIDVFYNTRHWLPIENADRRYTPGSDYLHAVVRPWVQAYVPDDARYDDTFDIFEYLLGLTYMDLTDDSRAPLGRFVWRWHRRPQPSPADKLTKAILSEAESHPLLATGFFNRSVARAKEIIERYETLVTAMESRTWP